MGRSRERENFILSPSSAIPFRDFVNAFKGFLANERKKAASRA